MTKIIPKRYPHLTDGGSYNSPTTMTPHKEYVYTSNNQLAVYQLRSDGMLSSAYGGSIRPVINLKADVKFIGNGTIDSPYEIVME